MVAVGFPKTERSVRFRTKTFSVQVPETAMELGPTAGREANAAVIVVKAPGVPPGQPTVVSVANARLESISISKAADKNLGPKQRSFIRFPRTYGFEIL